MVLGGFSYGAVASGALLLYQPMFSFWRSFLPNGALSRTFSVGGGSASGPSLSVGGLHAY